MESDWPYQHTPDEMGPDMSAADNRNQLNRRSAIAAVLMGSASIAAKGLTPTQKLVSKIGNLDLERTVPPEFGDWRELKSAQANVVNPQQNALLNSLYSQILNRTYVSRDGAGIMLSIAYGEDQRDATSLHYPEVCYPAQGFKLVSNLVDDLNLDVERIPVRRLSTKLGDRNEPVTYWTKLGLHTYRGALQKKRYEIDYGIRNIIPDGLLFRISSIDADPQHAYSIHDGFARALHAATAHSVRQRLF